jgi:molybdopterin/thiamine biosynthesis adenylyltransferase
MSLLTGPHLRDEMGDCAGPGARAFHEQVTYASPFLAPFMFHQPDVFVGFKAGDAAVLCVGAGGICCEALKTLAASGIKRIAVVIAKHCCADQSKMLKPSRNAQIDPDAVEASGIGWQLLFSAQHVGRSKAEVAAEALRSLRPLVDITAYHMDTRDASFGVDFFRRFNVVVSMAENVEDKCHVNRLCLAANIPLISAGASEYMGQVGVGHNPHRIPPMPPCAQDKPGS